MNNKVILVTCIGGNFRSEGRKLICLIDKYFVFKEATPLIYVNFDTVLLAHFSILRRMLFVSGSGYLPFQPFVNLSITEKVLKLMQSLVYYISFFSLLMGWILAKGALRKDLGMMTFGASLLIGLLLFISYRLENRFIFGLYPSGLLSLCFIINQLYS